MFAIRSPIVQLPGFDKRRTLIVNLFLGRFVADEVAAEKDLVDVEQVRPYPKILSLAHRFFAPEEREVLAELPPVDQPLAFFRCWTRKEAFIKALGKGLSQPLNSFVVTMRGGEMPALRSFQNQPQAADQWQLTELWPAPDSVAALMLPRIAAPWHIRRFNWRPID